MIRRLLTVPLLLAAGCAGDQTRYPSLAHRPIEDRGFAEPVTPPPAPVAPDPALDATIAASTASLATIAAGFDAAAAKAESAARVGGARSVGSEAWLDAQTALAALDDWRAQLSALQTDAEQAAIARAATLSPAYTGLTDLADRLGAERDREDAAITRIAAMLPAA